MLKKKTYLRKQEKVTNNLYAERNIFEKVGKFPLNIASMLIFTYKTKIPILKHLKESPDRKKNR